MYTHTYCCTFLSIYVTLSCCFVCICSNNSDVFGSFSHNTACIKHLCIIKNINIIFSYLFNNPYKIASIGLPDELHVFSEKLSHPCVSQGSLHPCQLHPCDSASFFKFGFKCKGFPILDPTQPYLPSNSIVQLRFFFPLLTSSTTQICIADCSAFIPSFIYQVVWLSPSNQFLQN